MKKRFAINPEQIPLLTAWGDLLMNELKDTALQTMQEEGLQYERMTLYSNHIVVAETDVQGKPANSEYAINIVHKYITKSILIKTEKKESGKGVIIYELQR